MGNGWFFGPPAGGSVFCVFFRLTTAFCEGASDDTANLGEQESQSMIRPCEVLTSRPETLMGHTGL